ncbi:hypothetical protein LR48_Vigan08g001800 [Vigna angularis]|uniref:Uncharacterized protein n=1 Tax=Phaseolus angularis TaxID=3914 RepID=A0A0L9V2L4_PHAAN|nr:hypothetical protein LR48_Vigan08g001800 [Vigna angularis]
MDRADAFSPADADRAALAPETLEANEDLKVAVESHELKKSTKRGSGGRDGRPGMSTWVGGQLVLLSSHTGRSVLIAHLSGRSFYERPSLEGHSVHVWPCSVNLDAQSRCSTRVDDRFINGEDRSEALLGKERAVNSSRERGQALSKPNGKARSLGSTPSSKQRGKALSKPNGKTRSLGSTPRSKQRGKALSKTKRTSGKSRSVNVEGREVKPSRLMLRSERTSGKSRSVNVEGREPSKGQPWEAVQTLKGREEELGWASGEREVLAARSGEKGERY